MCVGGLLYEALYSRCADGFEKLITFNLSVQKLNK